MFFVIIAAVAFLATDEHLKIVIEKDGNGIHGCSSSCVDSGIYTRYVPSCRLRATLPTYYLAILFG